MKNIRRKNTAKSNYYKNTSYLLHYQSTETTGLKVVAYRSGGSAHVYEFRSYHPAQIKHTTYCNSPASISAQLCALPVIAVVRLAFIILLTLVAHFVLLVALSFALPRAFAELVSSTIIGVGITFMAFVVVHASRVISANRILSMTIVIARAGAKFALASKR